MKRFLLALTLVAPLLGCGPSFPTIDGQALAEAVAAVREQTVKICRYFPSDESVIGILTSVHPVLETAHSIAKQICDAVTEALPPLSPVQMQNPRRGDDGQCPMVRGVCITGQFISKDQSKPDDEPRTEMPQ